MTWRQALRAIAAEARRQEREARRRQREAEKAYQAAVKASAQERARLEVEAFDAYIETLTTVHREAGDRIDWQAILQRPEPRQPRAPSPVSRAASESARQKLADYQPGFFTRLFGLQGERQRLQWAIDEIVAREQAEEQAGQQAHADAVRRWEDAKVAWADQRELAERVLAGNAEAYGEVIRSLDSLQEVGALIGKQTMQMSAGPRRIEASYSVEQDTVVPAEEKVLTARSAVSTKKMAAPKRLEIYEDYVCGTALRIARELLAAVPIQDVLVHVEASILNTGTGHFERKTILSVLCPRDAIERVNWDRADASDVVGTLLHAMKRLGRGKGFTPVERLAPAEP